VKRIFGLVFVCGAASSVAANAVASAPTTHDKARAAPAKPTSKLAIHPVRALHRPTLRELAPGDEYFGPFKLSIIGINNTIRDIGRRYDVNHDNFKASFTSAEMTERAIRDWEKKYPHDDQLPRAVYVLQRLYTKVLFQQSRDRAHATAQWLFLEFGKSPQARQMKKTLALEHLAPLPPLALATTPPPYNSIFGKGYPSEFTAPPPVPQQALPVPTAAPSPQSSPSPSVPLPQPSTSPSVPSPQPSPSPSAPSPQPSASPSAPSPLPSVGPTSPGSGPPAVATPSISPLPSVTPLR